MSHTEYSVIEDNGHVKITVLLDHPRCITTVGTVVPQLRTPVDAASKVTVLKCFIVLIVVNNYCNRIRF